MKYDQFRHKVECLPFFSAAQLGGLTDRPDTLRVQITQWRRRGLVQVLRRGVYVLGPKERRVEPSLFFLANQMYIPSYISLESALSYYDLIPEHVSATTSVTARKTCRFDNSFGHFSYQHVRLQAYEGFIAVKESDTSSMLMATPEKAIVDFLYLNLQKFSPGDRHIFGKSYRFQNCETLKRRKILILARMFASKKLYRICKLFIEEMCA